MSVRAIRWTARALRRLDAIGANIASDNPAAAARVVARIVAALGRLPQFPASGRPGRIAGTRELVFADIPYVAAYRVASETIEVLTVMHAAQKWPERL